MESLFCFNPDTSSPIGELVIHIVHYNPNNDPYKPIIPEDTIVEHATYNAFVDDVLQNIRGRYNISYEIELVYCGKLLSKTETLQLEYFESFEALDEVSLMFRSRLSLVILLHKPLVSHLSKSEATDIAKLISDAERLEKEIQQRREQELYEQQLIDQSDISIQSANFNLLDQLELIECAMFYDTLSINGFDQEVFRITIRRNTTKIYSIFLTSYI